MFPLYKKELRSFFSSLTGYFVIIVFLLINSLIIWFLPGDMNILDSGYATLLPLFNISPWIFMFLVPAITMRLLSEEKRSGTIELLFTRPLSDIHIILAKYFAGLSLVVFSIIPTFIYFFSVYYIGNPIGNIDVGGTWGSYIGLFFLASVYVSIGIFSSALTQNPIIAFIVGIATSLFFYMGFDALAKLKFWGTLDSLIIQFGINDHYISMSRGVIDTRDVLYFIAISTIFILFTRLILEIRKW